MVVYLTLQKQPYGCRGNYNKTITIQKCGNKPYELALRFAQCCLRCGGFAAGYSWADKFRKNKRVKSNIPIERVIRDFREIPTPSPYSSYNWLRILGGEPLLNNEYIEYLFDCLVGFSKINSSIFNNGILFKLTEFT